LLKTFVSDIITVEEISKWKRTCKILISSQTGTGKTEFIKNNLYQYCQYNHARILLLSNRTLLKNQNIVELEGKLDVVTTVNYQELENKILYGSSISKLFDGYQYIVYDESHYLFSDSQFNRNTDILLEPLSAKSQYDYPNTIFIFITATPDILVSYYNNFDFVYNLI
jgi:late competence protein required for DNA uptake (superfamily II DNA/RNA helicase)